MKKFFLLFLILSLISVSCSPSVTQDLSSNNATLAEVGSPDPEPTSSSPSSQSEFSFFNQIDYTLEELEELSQAFDFTNFTDEYVFEMFTLDKKIEGAEGFCVIGEQLYLSDLLRERIHVLDKQFEIIDTIRDGSDAETWFAPRGLCEDKDGNLVAITDVNSLTNIGHILNYNNQYEVTKDVAFTLKPKGDYLMTNDVAVLDNGDIYFTVLSNSHVVAKIYKVLSDDSVDGVGMRLFGWLCPSVARDELMFVNDSFGLDSDNHGIKGLPALFRFNSGKITGLTKLPPVTKSSLSSEEKKTMETMTNLDGDLYTKETIDSYRHTIFTYNGLNDLALVGNEYFVITSAQPAIFVFDEDMQYSRSIKLLVNDEWNTPVFTQMLKDGKVTKVLPKYLDSDEEGNLFIICTLHTQDGKSDYIGVRATKKAG